MISRNFARGFVDLPLNLAVDGRAKVSGVLTVEFELATNNENSIHRDRDAASATPPSRLSGYNSAIIWVLVRGIGAMKEPNRREPFISDGREGGQAHDELFDSRLPPKDERDTRLHIAAIAVTLVCGLFVADWVYQRYAEYRAAQTLKEMVTDLQESTSAAAEQSRREAERTRLALREQRANTNQGKRLAKNCSDWRRAHQDIGGPTTEREMKRHCRLYEEYLDKGSVARSVS
jgi:hypothetical protein